MSCALFDLDHTLLGHDCQALFANFVLQKQPRRRAELIPFVFNLPLRALKLIDTTELKARFHRYLCGLSEAELDQLSSEFVEQEALPRIYPKLKAEIERHLAEGRQTVLVSASPSFYVRKLGEALGFDLALGTEFVRQDPWPKQPQILGGNNKREAKIENLRKAGVITSEWNLAKDGCLVDSWAYSDSDADLPILEAAQHAICVHPKPALKAIAQERNWPIWYPEAERGANSSFSSVKQALGLFPLVGKQNAGAQN